MDPDWINLVRIFKLVEFRDAMPPLFSVVRISATLAVIGVVVGEMVGGNIGLDYILIYREGSGNTALVFVSIIILTVIGFIAYAFIIILERCILHYVPKSTYTNI